MQSEKKEARIVFKVFCWAFACSLILPVLSKAQDKTVNFPKVGEKIRDYEFTDLVNYSDKTLKISDFKGQWLVIDFWSRWCTGCIASFPKIENMHREFSEKAKILMVGLYHNRDKNRSAEKLTKFIFSSRAKNYSLTFTNAFDDLSGEVFDIGAVPAIFIINPDGIIVSKTIKIDSSLLASLMEGKQLNGYPKSISANEPVQKSYNPALPLLTTGKMSNGGTDTSFLARSVFSNWNSEMPEYSIKGFEDVAVVNGIPRTGFAEMSGLSLSSMFRIAYMGKDGYGFQDTLYSTLSNKIIYEVGTKGDNVDKLKGGFATYAYSLTIPCDTFKPEITKKILLEDLHRYLGITSKIELRKLEAYNLVVTDKNKVLKLRTEGGEREYRSYTDRTGFKMVNYSINDFIKFSNIHSGLIVQYNFREEDVPAIIDKTGLNFNIDFNFMADYTDWQEVLNILRQNGLDLVIGEIKKHCVVVQNSN